MTSNKIINTYMTLVGMYTLAASLIWSVNTLFLLDAGLGIGEVFLANALFSAGMVLLEIPTGVVADSGFPCELRRAAGEWRISLTGHDFV